MQQIVAPHNFVLLEHKIEPLHKAAGQSTVQGLQELVTRHALAGWELVEACGDEVNMPVLIFRRLGAGAASPRYLVEEIPVSQGQDNVQAVSAYLWQMHDKSWLPVCVMDSLVSCPVAVFKLTSAPLQGVEIQLVTVPVDLFGRGSISIVYELLDQQITRNLTLKCIMHGGVHPILVLISKDPATNYTYLVEHAKGNIFINQARAVADLLAERCCNGWEVCGAFEDWFLWPNIVFRRLTDMPPVVPLELEGVQ